MEETNTQGNQKEKRSFLREFFSLGEVGDYFFRKKNSERPSNVNIKMMHWINRLAIFMFLIGVVYLILKRLL